MMFGRFDDSDCAINEDRSPENSEITSRRHMKSGCAYRKYERVIDWSRRKNGGLFSFQQLNFLGWSLAVKIELRANITASK